MHISQNLLIYKGHDHGEKWLQLTRGLGFKVITVLHSKFMIKCFQSGEKHTTLIMQKIWAVKKDNTNLMIIHELENFLQC